MKKNLIKIKQKVFFKTYLFKNHNLYNTFLFI